MNIFYSICMVFFASYCSSQDEPPKTIINTDSENTIRCDTYLYTQTHEITHTWAIHNFSHYETKGPRQIFSPILQTPTDDEFMWNIKMQPNGSDEKNDTISLYVFLIYDSREVITDTNISIINHKNEILLSEITKRRKITGGRDPITCKYFCKKDDIFRNRMLQNDTLTLSINIRWFEPSYETIHNISGQNKTNSSDLTTERNILKCNLLENLEWILKNPEFVDMIFSTNAIGIQYQCDDAPIQVHEIKYIWAIHNFSVYETLSYTEIFSPSLQAPTTDKYTWHIKLTPNDHQIFYGRGNYVGLDVYLSEKSNATQALAKYDISIINDEKQVLHNVKSPSEKLKAGDSKHWWNLCRKTSYSFIHEFLNNDTLTLFIHIKWIEEPSKVNVSHQCDTSSPAATLDPTLTKCCNLSQMLESMLENPEFADVVFTTNGNSYPAHKNILAARSQVFATMLREKKVTHGISKKIEIKVAHMSEEVLRAMLRYIYTGKCENLNELADKLFIAAVKYDVDGLRDICERALCKAVSAENAAAMLEFAEKHRANELKSKAVEFIGKVSDQKS